MLYAGYSSVEKHNYCLVYSSDFSVPLDTNFWRREIQVGGFGTGEFEWTTENDNNSYVEDGVLYIMPTLTEDAIGEGAINNGYTVNLTQSHQCTSSSLSDCVSVSNSTLKTVVNPVQSARLSSLGNIAVTYGKVEVEAKLPIGDWLWPAIWMLPVNNVYGPWPQSGEIDVMESRGNGMDYAQGGYNMMSSTLHWGKCLQIKLRFRLQINRTKSRSRCVV